MRFGFKTLLATALSLSWITPTMAGGFWDCNVPEIDAGAGVTAIAALVSVSMIAYQRFSK